MPAITPFPLPVASSSKSPSGSFHTLKREREFTYPSA